MERLQYWGFVGCESPLPSCISSIEKPTYRSRTSINAFLFQYGGDCPPKTKCFFNKENQSPYCI